MKTYNVRLEITDSKFGLSKGKSTTRIYNTKVEAENADEAERKANKEYENIYKKIKL